MDEKERVLTLASASRMTGVEQKKLQLMIDDGKLEAVKTEGGNLLISESSLKLIIEESQIVETNHNQNTLSEDVKKLLSQAAFFIERQESELKTYKERERSRYVCTDRRKPATKEMRCGSTIHRRRNTRKNNRAHGRGCDKNATSPRNPQ